MTICISVYLILKVNSIQLLQEKFEITLNFIYIFYGKKTSVSNSTPCNDKRFLGIYYIYIFVQKKKSITAPNAYFCKRL